jgi:hypothetical protein
LEARINGPWRTNGANGAIDWTEFDDDTVECVLSFLYIEDYDERGQTFVRNRLIMLRSDSFALRLNLDLQTID